MKITNKIFAATTKALILLMVQMCTIGMNAQLFILPYYTGFDNAEQQSGWQQYRQGYESVNEWHIEPYIAPGVPPTNCLTHDYNVEGDDSQTVVDWFVSPAMIFPSESKVSLKIRVSGFSEPLEDNLEILFGTLSQNPALGSYAVISNLSQMSPMNTWLDTILDIPFTANEGYLAIRYKTVGSNWKTYSIDDISITLNPLNVDNQDASIIAQVFPNPVADRLMIQSVNELQEIAILDYQGRYVLTERKTGKSADILLGQLASGVYILKVTTEQGIYTEQIVRV